MTVSWRRSAAGEAEDDARSSGTLPGRPVTALPQSPQNRLSGGFSLPQALHNHGSGDPQSPQNFLPLVTFVPQRGQIMPLSSRRRPARPLYHACWIGAQ